MKTRVHMLLDRSGSMMACWDMATASINEYLTQLKLDKSPCRFSLAVFDSDSYETVIDDELEHIGGRLSLGGWPPRAATPLLDAIGKSFAELTQEDDGLVYDRFALIIQTDGQENCSREYSLASIRKLVEEHKDKPNWLIVFLGAGLDAFAQHGVIGTNDGSSMSYSAQSATSWNNAYVATANVTNSFRLGNKRDFTDDEKKT